MLRRSAAPRLKLTALALSPVAFVLGLLTPSVLVADNRAIGSEHSLNGSSGVVLDGGEALHYEVIDGIAIHDGDMVLGTVEDVVEATRRWRSRKAATGSLPERRELSPEGGDFLWPGGIMPYEIEPGFTARALQDIEAAIHEWNSRTVLTLVERTTESSFVQFRPRSSTPSGSSCSAAVGYRAGARGVWLRGPRGCGVGTTVHEIGHSAGLRHEHQRKDRDRHVQVSDMLRSGPNRYSYSNIRPIGGRYDYASSMHYAGGIETIPPGMPIRTYRWLSAGDIDGVARMYGMPPTATTISTNPPGLEIVVDGEHVVTPASFDWDAGSEHVLQVPSPQSFGSVRYVFGRWNDGGHSERTITSDPEVTWYEASFVVQKQFFTCATPAEAGDVTVLTESNGSFHTVGAPIEFEAVPKPDSDLQFTDWDWDNTTTRHGESKNPATVASVSRARNWTTYQANSRAGPFFTIDTDMDGAWIRVDGRVRNLPYAVPATDHQDGIALEAPETTYVSRGVRYRFKGWSDGGEQTHRVDVPAAGGSLRLDLAREYFIYGRPLGRSDRDAALQIMPESEDGYYEEGTQVTMTAVPTSDRHFAGWVGDVSSSELVQTVQADSPKALWPVFAESLPVPPGESTAVTLAATDQLELHHRSGGFNVLVPSNAEVLTVTFQSATPGAEVDLYISLGREVEEQLGDDGETEAIIADFESKAAGTSETISIDRSSIPPLLDEIYYIGLAVHPTQTEIQGTLSVEIRRSGITGASPTALTFISSSTSDPASQTIRLSHRMIGSVRYRIDSSLASVTVSPQEWVQTESGTTDIAVTVNSAGQQLGSHHGTLTVVQVSGDETLSTGIEIPVLVGIIDGSSTTTSAPEISRVQFTSRPGVGNTYVEAAPIEVEVQFGEPVNVMGTPRLALTVGDQTRQADGVGSETNQCGGYERMLFRYEVQAEDLDPDGIGIGADALTLNGGTIRSLSGTDANLDLGNHAFANARGHSVDGSLGIAPRVVDMRIWRGPQNGTSYGAGEWIWVWVDLDTGVEVTGDPELALTIGSRTRPASFHASSATTLWFRYAVQAGDMDTDGIGIGADALTLNGGTIRSADGADANLDLQAHAVANSSEHAVNGDTPATLVVREVRIRTQPLDGVAYGRGEGIGILVAFTGPIEASGPVQLVVDIGGYKKRAIYDAYQPSTLWFTYRVQSDDNDPDGVSIPADGLLLNSGSISSPAGATVDVDLGDHSISNAEGHRVRGGG
ncbi:MAG: M12 family metallopeptidase [Bryobacterales bacterium]|nr:M12 family metallopeptidase [Bryobacterales bacterium]